MFKGLLNKTKDLKDEAHVGQSLEDAYLASSTAIDVGKMKASDLFESYWPKVETFVLNHALPLATESLTSDDALRALFGEAFALLPIPLRLILPKATFIEMAMGRREPLLRRLQDLRATPHRAER